MVGAMQVSYRICLKTMNGDNLTRHEKAIHNPLVAGTIEYHSTHDDVALKMKLRMVIMNYSCQVRLNRHINVVIAPIQLIGHLI